MTKQAKILTDAENPWKDRDHPGNKIRPRVVCIGCGTKGCITAWGPWCFECNVERMTRLNRRFDEIRASLEKK